MIITLADSTIADGTVESETYRYLDWDVGSTVIP